MRCLKLFLSFLLMMIGAACFSQVVNSDIYILTDVDTVRVGQTFRIRYCSEARTDSFIRPDLSEFEIVKDAYMRELEMEGNHKVTIQALCYDVKAKKGGSFTIPSASVIISDRKYTIEPKQMFALALDENFKFHYTLELDPKNPKVGNTFQLILTMNAKPDQPPFPDLWNLSIERQTSRIETVDGVSSYVFIYYLKANDSAEHEIPSFDIYVANQKYQTEKINFVVKK